MKKKTVRLLRTLTTTAPTDENSYYWESACKDERRMCTESMGAIYDQMIFLTDDNFVNGLSWKELMYRLRRVRGLFFKLGKVITPEQCLEKFIEDLPDGYLSD